MQFHFHLQKEYQCYTNFHQCSIFAIYILQTLNYALKLHNSFQIFGDKSRMGGMTCSCQKKKEVIECQMQGPGPPAKNPAAICVAGCSQLWKTLLHDKCI